MGAEKNTPSGEPVHLEIVSLGAGILLKKRTIYKKRLSEKVLGRILGMGGSFIDIPDPPGHLLVLGRSGCQFFSAKGKFFESPG